MMSCICRAIQNVVRVVLGDVDAEVSYCGAQLYLVAIPLGHREFVVVASRQVVFLTLLSQLAQDHHAFATNPKTRREHRKRLWGELRHPLGDNLSDRLLFFARLGKPVASVVDDLNAWLPRMRAFSLLCGDAAPNHCEYCDILEQFRFAVLCVSHGGLTGRQLHRLESTIAEFRTLLKSPPETDNDKAICG